MSSRLIHSFFLFFITLTFSSGEEWDGFLGKFTTLSDNSGFFKMPFTKNEAVNSNPPYSDAEFVDSEFDVTTYCLKNDPHVCPLFDKNDRVAGLRISHLKSEVADDITKFPYKYDDIPIFTSSKLLGHNLWQASFLFTNPENLKKGGQGKITTKETADSLWVRLSNGWIEIPRNECTAQQEGWKKQGFLPLMGRHYTMGQTHDCSKFLPLLPMYHKGRLIAMSFAPVGKYKAIERDWFDYVPAGGVLKKIVPDDYEPCLEKWAKLYTLSSFHFYFVKHPQLIESDEPVSC